MLRAGVLSARALGGKPVRGSAGRQWPLGAGRQANLLVAREFASGKQPLDPSKPASLPASETRTSVNSNPPPAGAEGKIGQATIPPQNVPLSPPTPENVIKTPENPIVPPSPPPVTTKPGIFTRLRRLVLSIAILGALAFGGGVWYSRVNDNFHDFFTEYIPFGEQVVLYLEEQDFRKRHPLISNRAPKPRETGGQVKVPAQSGASWRVADNTEPEIKQSRAVQKVAQATAASREQDKPASGNTKEAETPTPEPDRPVQPKSQAVVTPTSAKSEPEAPDSPRETPKTSDSPTTFKSPEVNEPSKMPPIPPIDLLKMKDAEEPLVQDLVRMLNDVITVINADNAHGRYRTTMAKAKSELSKVGNKIQRVKEDVERKAAEAIRSRIDEFDKAATDLVERVESAMVAQEAQWRKEFEEEMQTVRQSYDERAKLLLERERQLYEEKMSNKLLEQSVALKREFVEAVKSRVEEERDGRLGKLRDLSSSITELEKLTSGWNDVVDTNLKTQKLHVAVQAVRASLEDTQQPRPFISELVTVKEVASGDAVVDAAIASINPASYQRGVSTSAQLIDRFRRVADEVRKASLLPDEAGVASHASSWLLSKILFRKQGLTAGYDVESILTRAQTYLEEGDLDAAAREMNGLDGWAKTLSRDWLGEVRKVLEVRQALEVMATEARLESLRVD